MSASSGWPGTTRLDRSSAGVGRCDKIPRTFVSIPGAANNVAASFAAATRRHGMPVPSSPAESSKAFSANTIDGMVIPQRARAPGLAPVALTSAPAAMRRVTMSTAMSAVRASDAATAAQEAMKQGLTNYHLSHLT
jgi:hypothetical protein